MRADSYGELSEERQGFVLAGGLRGARLGQHKGDEFLLPAVAVVAAAWELSYGSGAVAAGGEGEGGGGDMEGISEKGEGRNGILEEASIAHGLVFGVGFLDLCGSHLYGLGMK